MIHQAFPVFAATSGPRSARMLIIGEAWGESEAQLRKPFVGESGKELWRMLGEAMPQVSPDLHAAASAEHRYGLAWVRPREAWLEAAGIAMTNVLALRPPGNKLESLCGSKAEVGGATYSLPAVAHGKYLRPEYLPELERLWQEIREIKPNLILALGNTACWGVLQVTNIGNIRGSITETIRGYPPEREEVSYKCLPTYHPAGVMRNWSWRPIVVADLMKAGRECQFPEIRRPRREALVSPTLAEIDTWVDETTRLGPSLRALSCDIETGGGQIKCISFATSASRAICIPFVDQGRAGYSHWPSLREELLAWSAVRALLSLPCPKLGQNFLYDLQYITRMGILPVQCTEDTMLLHHSLFPELQKGLGFLGSVYTNESSWKLMRLRKADTEKRDE